MPRLTKNTKDGVALETGVTPQQAAEKLAAFENWTQALLAEQQESAEKMARLRERGQEKSVKFRELFAKKLTNAAILAQLSVLGLSETESGKQPPVTLPTKRLK